MMAKKCLLYYDLPDEMISMPSCLDFPGQPCACKRCLLSARHTMKAALRARGVPRGCVSIAQGILPLGF
jgi:hypothetical protein